MDGSIRLPWSQRVCFVFGHWFNDMCATMWCSYLIFYLQMVLDFDSTFSGLVLLVGQVANALFTPLMGLEASGKPCFCGRYGKRKTVHLIGSICLVVSFPFIFTACSGCQTATELGLTVVLLPIVIVYQLGWAAIYVSHLALIPYITPHATERDFLSAFRYAVNVIADISTYVVVWCVFDLTGSFTRDTEALKSEYDKKFTIIVCIIVAVGSILTFVFHIVVKEPSSPSVKGGRADCEQSCLTESRVSNGGPLDSGVVTLSCTEWLKDIPFYQIGLLYMCARIYQSTNLVFMPLYLDESLQSEPDLIAIIPLVSNVAGLFSSVLLPSLFKALNKKVVFLIGAGFSLGSSIWILVGQGAAYSTQGIYGVGVLNGFASSAMVVSALSFTHDLIGTSSESGAFVYGCISLWDKMANGIAGMIVQYLHSIYCIQCDCFYKKVLSYGAGGVTLLACLVLYTIRGNRLGERNPTKKVDPVSSASQTDSNYDVDIDSSSSERQPLFLHASLKDKYGF